MDLYKTIRELQDEKQKLEQVIASLEQLAKGVPLIEAAPPRRRGRKSMGPQERKEVSERMKKYWENRRNNRVKSGGDTSLG